MSNTLEQIANHLQFLGYEITQKDEVRIARHPQKMNVSMRDFKGGILFAAYNGTKDSAKSDTAGFLRFLNVLNSNALVARFYSDKDTDLCIEAWYPDVYEKDKFGLFWDAWESDSLKLLLANAAEAMQYLR